MKPFLSVSRAGRVAIHPHSPGLLAPFSLPFRGQDCVVLLNHVRYSLFRVAIAPEGSWKTYYLNVELSQATMVEYFSFEE